MPLVPGFYLKISYKPKEAPCWDDPWHHWVFLTRDDVEEWRREFPDDKTFDDLIRVSARHRQFPKGTRPRDLKQFIPEYLADLYRLESSEIFRQELARLGHMSDLEPTENREI